METPDRLVVFTVDEQRYGIALSTVQRVARAVEVTALPKAPDIVLGVINVQGRIVPVVDLRRRFRLPQRDVFLTDHLIIAETTQRPVALVVDEVLGVLPFSTTQVASAGEVLAGIDPVEGVVKLEDGLVLIYDLDKCLSLEEARALDEAITIA